MSKNDVIDLVNNKLQYSIEKVFDQYGVFLVGLLLGFLFAWYGKRILSDRRYLKQLNLRLQERDERINELNSIILDRMDKIKVEKKDHKFFKNLKRFFRKKK